MKSLIEQGYVVKAKPEEVWDALVNPKTIERWGAGPAQMSDVVGEKFSLWGGDVFGKNLEVVKNKKLVQEWYGGEWDTPSIATIELSFDGRNTEIILIHKDPPKDEEKDLAEGWKDYYFGPIKRLLENSK